VDILALRAFDEYSWSEKQAFHLHRMALVLFEFRPKLKARYKTKKSPNPKIRTLTLKWFDLLS